MLIVLAPELIWYESPDLFGILVGFGDRGRKFLPAPKAR